MNEILKELQFIQIKNKLTTKNNKNKYQKRLEY